MEIKNLDQLEDLIFDQMKQHPEAVDRLFNWVKVIREAIDKNLSKEEQKRLLDNVLRDSACRDECNQ
jgi:hypothetical protein